MASYTLHRSPIPPEMTDYIIDHLHDDTPALGACALVCRSWLPAARFHLFSSVSVHPWKKDAFLALLASSTQGGPPRLDSFASSVRHLYIREGRGAFEWEQKWLSTGLPGLCASLSLGALESLEIEQVTWEFLAAAARRALIEHFAPRVRRLKLRQFEFRTSADMVGFLSRFERLEELRLDGVRWERETVAGELEELEAVGAVAVPRKLEVLGMNYGRKGPVLEWMMSASGGRIAQAHSVRLGMVTARDTPVVASYLKELGSSLRELHLHFGTEFYMEQANLVEQFDLSANTNLTAVHIYDLVVDAQAPLPWVTALLRQIKSYRIRQVSFGLQMSCAERAEAVDWAGLEKVFKGVNWAGLEDVKFLISSNEADCQCAMARMTREKMQDLEKRGVLGVEAGLADRSML
ncbi:hypothetical protein CONPUDRAFT_167459 [Coniophora puteana RWD-64-598 SS2]|uniref:F-box domain-containing protein n=1 Tax=Coniophora puteana (strain RWD-64-598) TaxID=741705 RepID=A0A5M3MII4_CONPW|nr:uncharacterized protein CONPUDRAFT_167459 [Coniophora puteana RWD-64-598 SS2]EIW78455.1 hypothetical protein CONPUDRAFT_167459 [Coniophora puteana RWD-64-598 SS2]